MIKTIGSRYFGLSLLVLFFGCGQEQTGAFDESPKNAEPQQEYLSYVNTLMGTDSDFSLSNGNTYPAIAMPWGMNFWTPQTGKMGDGWGYKYDDNTIRGIKQTHQPSPWINDYAAFSLMAVTGELKYKEDERASWFSHKAEVAKPDYYKVYLADYDVVAEVAPTERAASFRFTFPEAENSYILLDAFFKGSAVTILPEERKIIGYCRNNSGGVPENFHNYFVAEFDTDFEVMHTWEDNWALQNGATQGSGEHVGAIVGFKTQRGQQVHVKVASSFISPEQAQLNLNREIGSRSFDQVRELASAAWEQELGRIQVKDSNIDHLRTFYSCLYRVLLFPRKFYELDAQENIVHYSPYNGEVLPGYMFTDNGFWDTFRAVFPFFNMMYPELNEQIMAGLANTYKESGWLPEWASPGHRDSMIGSNSAINVADAYLRGNVRPEDVAVLLEAVLKNADVGDGRPTNATGRAGLEYYNTLGYVPYDVGINENAARTLEYAFADFAIAKMAEDMGRSDLMERFYGQSMNYKNLFDPTTNLMRGKNMDGSFQEPFNPLKWGDAFTEGNSLHYTWSVFHDMQGLVELMGGDQAFVAALDQVFEMPPDFDASYYGFTIHEIREMQIVNMGNYAHGNQPIQHMIYLYNYAGAPWKAQQRIREVLTTLYTPNADGYCGDEDNGQTSAWYVFSALGFYPVSPATGQFIVGSPLFDEVKLHLQNGKTFTVTASNNGKGSPYIQQASLNGTPFDQAWLSTQTVQDGGQLNFTMGQQPNEQWAKDSRPYSYSLEQQ